MVLRFAGIAALALLSSACTYRIQTTAHDAPSAAYVEPTQGLYDESFGRSPLRHVPVEGASEIAADNASRQETAPARGNALGVSLTPSRPAGADASPSRPASTADAPAGTASADATSVEVSDTEYEEVEATPGTACYDAAVEAGITNGTCTLVKERTYLLVGEKAR